MNEAELKAQRNKALANYELKKMLARSGRVSAQEVEEARRIWEALRDYKPTEAARPIVATVPDPPAPKPPDSAVVVPAMAVDEFTRLIEDLTIERHEAHKQMCMRSNRLADYPDDQNVKDLVDEIQEWKRKRNEVAEKITFLRNNGRLPEPMPAQAAERSPEVPESAFLANLPADRYELNKLLVNSLNPKLYRAKQGLKNAKLEIWKAHYQKEVAKCQAAVDLAKSQLSALA
ncbi:hypothetical protein LX87_05188 [Larkinella arboricola]|uniref:Uncharacterized protein n=2 Tax=Larkinella arboricola TaxID=643671 RepID=A0A327WTZ7_LARAB|nr:hypothetical protein LX87_05188 [Larkinella arboricola]